MKKIYIVITYTAVILGMFALFSALSQEYTKRHHSLNIQRLIDEGVRLQATVIGKKVVKSPYKGTFSMPKKIVENRVYVKILEPPHQGEIVWQAAPTRIFKNIALGSTVHVDIKQNDLFIEELAVEESHTKKYLLAALGFLCIAIVANMKANQHSRTSDTT